MKRTEMDNKFFLLDRDSHPIAQGVMLTPSDPSVWKIRVLHDQAAAVSQLRELQLISSSDQQTPFLARVTDCHDDLVIYPLSGAWKGRRTIQAIDLSCGGIAFSCQDTLSDGETLEVIIPISRHPLVLACKVLRRLPSPEGRNHYALKFIDLCDDAEKLVREYVFGIQIRGQSLLRS
jgi:hypothetical protein